MLNDFEAHINKNFPELLSSTFLLTCSGGLDSIVLAHLCHKCKMNFAIAHCNFGLRGEASDGDEIFVNQLAKQLNKQFFVTYFDTFGYMAKNRISLQLAARELRYDWFREILKENGIDFLVTAHHADDNLETFLINLSRGTGIDGLIGIPSKTADIRRPLLSFSRAQILEFAENNSIGWREDVSNEDVKYLRNKIRLEIIPKLKELHPNFLTNFKNTLEYLSETNEISRHRLFYVKQQLFVEENGMISISIDSLKKLVPLSAYLYGLFSPYGFKEVGQIEELLERMSGKYLESKTHKLLKDRECLLLMEIANTSVEKEIYTIPDGVMNVKEPLDINFTVVDYRNDNTQNLIFVDKAALKFPLTLRKWKNGDYFHPIGMKGKKKLAKFFKDEKINSFSKEEQWLLCSDDSIVWVVGKRADSRYKVTEDTKVIVRIEVKNI
ncbi:tRNA lysidine(34) synthetase TilS [Maribacter sp. CXY002]|uniref:tRNA lysidine(34) synthetase TilS n=1 Tax=Maribacter luteocoastalis TaxID=3407671 RepID=UPI003B67E9C5